MPNRLPIPDDLQHLIEKRERTERRSGGRRRSAGSSQDSDASPDPQSKAAETFSNTATSTDATPKRRKQGDRRKTDRRQGNG